MGVGLVRVRGSGANYDPAQQTTPRTVELRETTPKTCESLRHEPSETHALQMRPGASWNHHRNAAFRRLQAAAAVSITPRCSVNAAFLFAALCMLVVVSRCARCVRLWPFVVALRRCFLQYFAPMSSGRKQYPFHLIEPKWQKAWDE